MGAVAPDRVQVLQAKFFQLVEVHAHTLRHNLRPRHTRFFHLRNQFMAYSHLYMDKRICFI